MGKNQAIVIGINQYDFLPPLKYARRDAETVRDFFIKEARFERIFFFSDNSEHIGGKSTKPFRANLMRVMRQLFKHPFMSAGDNFWFFFSGHGIPFENKDYLMPIDGDPEDVQNTGISTHDLVNRLRFCGADNVVVILDACRSGGKKSGLGIGQQTEKEAKRTGVISIFSCSPNQYSYEINELQQGVFTTALLEGLGVKGRCATVERLNQYLEYRVSELLKTHNYSWHQDPYIIAEPISRSNLILMPQYASFAEIATLKNDALEAEINERLDLAEQLWIRVLAAASGHDLQAIKAIQRIGIKLQAEQINSSSIDPPSSENKAKENSTTKTSNVKRSNNWLSFLQNKKPLQGDDLRLDLSLSFEEAIYGGEKLIIINQLKTCQKCGGTGIEFQQRKCSSCFGKQLVKEKKELKIIIPSGVDNGTRLRVLKEGDDGRNKGKPGNLYIYLFVDEDKELTRKDLNIYSTLKITDYEANKGCEKRIRTVDGFVNLKIPPNTKNKATFRLKNRGVPQLENPLNRGHHLVKVFIK